jgi:hypothetical protein
MERTPDRRPSRTERGRVLWEQSSIYGHAAMRKMALVSHAVSGVRSAANDIRSSV